VCRSSRRRHRKQLTVKTCEKAVNQSVRKSSQSVGRSVSQFAVEALVSGRSRKQPLELWELAQPTINIGNARNTTVSNDFFVSFLIMAISVYR